MTWSLVSPASRGIGFALARQLLQSTTAPVVATARKNVDGVKKALLDGLHVDEERLKVLRLDVLDETSIQEAAASCRERFEAKARPLQLAFLLPGILSAEKSPTQIQADEALLTLRTNTLGPMLLLKHFSPFLPKKRASPPVDHVDTQGLPSVATMAIMSARVGSISDNRLGGWYSYRASKAAVNQLVKTFDNHLQSWSGDRAMAVALHPGTVKTDLSRDFWTTVHKDKLFGSEWVAERLCELVNDMDLSGRGKCWDWQGKEIPP